MNGNAIMENSALRSVLEAQDSSVVSLVGTADSTGDKMQETVVEEEISSVPVVKPRKTYTTIFRHNKDIQRMIQILAQEEDITISHLMRGFVKQAYKIFQNRKPEVEP